MKEEGLSIFCKLIVGGLLFRALESPDIIISLRNLLNVKTKNKFNVFHSVSLVLQMNQAITDLNDRSKVLVERYRKEMKLRKKFHNELVELKGNIRVFCRVRPIIKEDGAGQQSENAVSFDSEDDAILSVDHKNGLKQFEVDKVFTPKSTQLEVSVLFQGLFDW